MPVSIGREQQMAKRNRGYPHRQVGATSHAVSPAATKPPQAPTSGGCCGRRRQRLLFLVAAFTANGHVHGGHDKQGKQGAD